MRRAPMLRGALGAVLAAILCAVLSGCVVVPRSGGVQVGGPLSVQEERNPVLNPSRPQPGASQADIVRGFLNAALNPSNGFAIAREYLTPEFSPRWNPVANVTIDTGLRSVSDDGTSAVVQAVADVDGHGVYQAGNGAAPVTLKFALAQVNGEWRISQASDGIVVEQSFFDTVFTEHSLYFLDPSLQYLVPDVRWFPTRLAATTRIISELLAGPADWLTGAVTTAFPEGTALATGTVLVSDGVASVDLTTDGVPKDTRTRVAMQRQLEQSLASVTGVSSVQILIEQAPLPAAPADSPGPVRAPAPPSTPYVLKGGAFGALIGGEVQAEPGIGAIVAQAGPSAVMALPEQGLAAVLREDGVSLVSGGGLQLVDDRPGLAPPAIDRHGWVWSVPSQSPTALRATQGPGSAVSVPAGWSNAASISAIAVSRDGTRLAALVQRGGEAVVLVSGIVRNGQGAPTSLTAPFDVAVSDGTGVGLDWADDSQLVTVVQLPSGTDRIARVPVGGEPDVLADSAEVTSVAGLDRPTQLRLLTADGTLLASRDPNWQTIDTGVSLLARLG